MSYKAPWKDLRDFLPRDNESPSPVFALEGGSIWSAQSRGDKVLRNVRQGRYSVAYPHDYSYGKSKKELRPGYHLDGEPTHERGTA